MKSLIIIASLFFYHPTETGYKKLQWSDFKMSPTKGNPKWIAQTAWNINLQIEHRDNGDYFTITPTFVSEKSFTRSSEDWVLSHEQTHYDLVIVFANKIKRALEPYQGAGPKRSIKAQDIYESLCNSLTAVQKTYDRETAHGTHEKIQKLWEERTNKQLTDAR